MPAPPREVCPRCGSGDIRALRTGEAPADERADNLTADADREPAEPPNTRCDACGHAWWLAPHHPPITPRREGVEP